MEHTIINPPPPEKPDLKRAAGKRLRLVGLFFNRSQMARSMIWWMTLAAGAVFVGIAVAILGDMSTREEIRKMGVAALVMAPIMGVAWIIGLVFATGGLLLSIEGMQVGVGWRRGVSVVAMLVSLVVLGSYFVPLLKMAGGS